MSKYKKNMEFKMENMPRDLSSRKMVGVIGGARADSRITAIARRLGKRIAEEGYVLVCGGLGGVMLAACRGARKAGGTTVGILPGSSRESANRYVTIPIVTSMSHARNAIIARTADILVAVGGRYGTLSEIAHAKAIGKRVIGIHTWEEVPGVESVESADEAISLIIEF
ncbi:MAG: TIGR00725 family protein [Elusimicrobiota bacterium]|nr:TIGR00725 family protein [Elusimicrobiota bacterium]